MSGSDTSVTQPSGHGIAGDRDVGSREMADVADLEDLILKRAEERFSPLLLEWVHDVTSWPYVDARTYFNRGAGPTGMQLYRGTRDAQHLFVSLFPGRSFQFKTRGHDLSQLPLRSTQDPLSDLLILPVLAASDASDEVRALTAFAYWAVEHPHAGV